MTPKARQSGGRPSRDQDRGVIVLAGEDQNDFYLATLIRAHWPDLDAAAKLVRINDPVRLRKKSGPDLGSAVHWLGHPTAVNGEWRPGRTS
ncbi:hypothetical protein [Streptomyces gilvus]|uniref:hypothetical protein n=1 Tax=Streptomyces gilvus TaxID=2920937 RepID=UPI001F1155FB|nr:hypothetical protein [Streptomyces sp. CME 23]MCH5676709.1 hypothetical protein [Streptomyces sp. CME 23]